MKKSYTMIKVIKPQSEIESLFSEIIHVPWGCEESIEWNPTLDLFETSNDYILVVDLPGVIESNIQLEATNHSITLRGERIHQFSKPPSRTIIYERKTGRFCRTVDLEHPIEQKSITSNLTNGIFQATLPKRQNNDPNGGNYGTH